MPKMVYTAYSKHHHYAAEMVSAYVLEQGCVPINPFMNFGYFLGDRVGRDLVRAANNTCVKRLDEVWHFGEVSDGAAVELRLAIEEGEAVSFYSIGKEIANIRPLNLSEIVFEDDVEDGRELKLALMQYDKGNVA